MDAVVNKCLIRLKFENPISFPSNLIMEWETWANVVNKVSSYVLNPWSNTRKWNESMWLEEMWTLTSFWPHFSSLTGYWQGLVESKFMIGRNTGF